MRNIGQQGLADFFSLMVVKDADWYSIILYNNAAFDNALHHQAFPLLSKILNLNGGVGLIPVIDAWKNSLKETEVTNFLPVNQKKEYMWE